MVNLIVSDSPPESGGAIMAWGVGLDGLGTATGFVVSFSCDLQLRFPHDMCRVSLRNGTIEATKE